MKRTTRPVIVSVPEWRNLQKQGKSAGIARSATIVRAADGSIGFDASSFAADRYGDTMEQAGWDLANFKANPVLLWAHSHSTPPVGKVGSIGLGTNGNLRAENVTFTPPEMHPFGDEVGQMVRAGFLNAVSVGFMPIEWEARYSQEGDFLGYNFKKMELLEISVVPVPANPQALIDQRAFTKSLAGWLEKPEESGPLASQLQAELATFIKAAADLQASADDEADGEGFARMVQLLERIAKATEAPRFTVRLGDLEVSGPDVASVKALIASVAKDTKALPAPADVAKAAPVTDADGDPTLRWLSGSE